MYVVPMRTNQLGFPSEVRGSADRLMHLESYQAVRETDGDHRRPDAWRQNQHCLSESKAG